MNNRYIKAAAMIMPVLLAAICLILVVKNNNQAGMPIPLEIVFSGEYSYDGKNWDSYDKNSDISSYEGDIVIKGHLDSDILEGGMLNFYCNHISVKIRVGEETVVFDSVDIEKTQVVDSDAVVTAAAHITPRHSLYTSERSEIDKKAIDDFFNNCFEEEEQPVKKYERKKAKKEAVQIPDEPEIIEEIEDEVHEINETGKDEYLDLENTIKDALVNYNIVDLIKFMVISIIPFVIFIIVFSKTFKVINGKLAESYKKANYKVERLQSSSITKALVMQELRRWAT